MRSAAAYERLHLAPIEHQELPFERIVELLNVPRDPAHNPIFQVNFRAQDGARLPLRLAGLETSFVPVDIGFSRFDLALELHVEPAGISGYFEFDRDLFDAATVSHFADDFTALLEQIRGGARACRFSQFGCHTAAGARPRRPARAPMRRTRPGRSPRGSSTRRKEERHTG